MNSGNCFWNIRSFDEYCLQKKKIFKIIERDLVTKESYNFKDILHPYRGPEELPNHGLWFKLLNSITVRTRGSKTAHPARTGVWKCWAKYSTIKYENQNDDCPAGKWWIWEARLQYPKIIQCSICSTCSLIAGDGVQNSFHYIDAEHYQKSIDYSTRLSTLSTQPPKCDVENCSNDLKMQSDGKEERFYLHQKCLHSICNGLESIHFDLHLTFDWPSFDLWLTFIWPSVGLFWHWLWNDPWKCVVTKKCIGIQICAQFAWHFQNMSFIWHILLIQDRTQMFLIANRGRQIRLIKMSWIRKRFESEKVVCSRTNNRSWSETKIFHW